MAASQPTTEPTKVQAINLFLAKGENWDADSDNDGVEVTLSPRDRDDKQVKTDGTVSAKLWYSEYDASYNRVKGEFIQEWINIPVSKDSYGFLGTKVRLEFNNFTAKSSDYGYLEVTLTTPDGKTFTAKQDIVGLG